MNLDIRSLELSNLLTIDEHELLFDNDELIELFASVLSHVTMTKPPGLQTPERRSILQRCHQMLASYLGQSVERAAVEDRAQGIVWTAYNSLTGRIEFRVIDVDEFNDVIGSTIYATEPETAATWLKTMLSTVSGRLPFDSLIHIREHLDERIKSRISGDAMKEEANSLFLNIFAQIAQHNKAPALECQLVAFKDSDHEMLEAFCKRHPQLALEPAKVLRAAIDIENLHVAAMNVIVKLSNDLLNSLNTQSFAFMAREHTGIGAEMPTRRTIAALANKSGKLFSEALYMIESKIKSHLMSETQVTVTMGRVDTEYSARQMVELVLAIAQNQIDNHSTFQLDEKAVKNVGFAVDEWWKLICVETLADNNLLALSTVGKDAGRARPYEGTVRFWYPIPKRRLR